MKLNKMIKKIAITGHGRVVAVTALCMLFGVGGFTAVANAKRLKNVFDPSAYVNQNQEQKGTVQFDDALFGADHSNGSDGMMLDQQAEDVSLEEDNSNMIQDGSQDTSGSEMVVYDGKNVDPDDDKYGIDYNEPETVISEYPDELADKNKGIHATRFEVVSGSLM